MPFISVSEYLMGRIKLEDLPEDQRADLAKLLSAVNGLLIKFGQYRKVTSGYRRPEDNAKANGAKNSTHMICQGVDLEDTSGDLGKFCLSNLKILENLGLYMEDYNSTHGARGNWVHLQIRRPASGNRIFIP